MASMNFQKCTTAKVGSMKRHFDKEERQTRSHANGDIDKSRTSENYFIGAKDWDSMYFSWKDHVKEMDELHPPTRVRADRVTGVLCECPCPWEIVEQGREEEFFEMVADHLKEKFGSEHFHGLTVHRDEVHTYKDRDGVERTSMVHCHALVTPYARWRDKKGLEHEGINGKNWETKQMLHDFNDSLNARCLIQFGMELNTRGLARGKTVEELKRESKAYEIERKSRQVIAKTDSMREDYREAQRELESVQERLREAESRLESAHLDVMALSEDEKRLKAEVLRQEALVQEKRPLIAKAEALERASKHAEVPEYKAQRLGDGLIVKTDEKTLKNAFLALSHERSIVKRERAIRAQERDARDKARAIVDKAKAEAKTITGDALEQRQTLAQLEAIRQDHPELFRGSRYIGSREHDISVSRPIRRGRE